MTERLSDERLAEIQQRLLDFRYGGGTVQDDIGELLAEVEHLRADRAELYLLASEARYHEWAGIELRNAVLDRCKP